jgi:hypothetical protein
MIVTVKIYQLKTKMDRYLVKTSMKKYIEIKHWIGTKINIHI